MITVYCLEFAKQTATPMLGAFSAYKAFQTLGAHCVLVKDVSEINDTDASNLAIGGIGFVANRLKQLGFTMPELPDYPEELHRFLGRKIWRSTINEVATATPPFFVKPVMQKFFTGLVYTGPRSLIGTGIQGENYPVLCSELIEPVAEFRVFVKYGNILDIRKYKGKYSITPDYSVIEQAVKQYSSAPAAYGIDFCVDTKGRTLLLEVNDAYALGDYGLFYLDYAKMISARWAEMTKTEDWFNF